MLSPLYRQHYQGLRQRFEQLSQQMARLSFEEFQALFQAISIELPADPEAVIGDRVQLYQTEINKQMRLLATDLMFLKTARQAATQEQRWQMMGDRLKLLLTYCDGVLEL
jgi:hypothetical protein